MVRSMYAAGAAAVLALAGSTQGAVYFDGVFAQPDWTLTNFSNASGVGSVTVGSHAPAGGNPNEFRRVSNTLTVSGPNGAVIGFHMNVNAFYDPFTQGAITSIDYSEDSINFVSDLVVPGNGQGTGLAILQGGTYYRLQTPSLVMPYSGFSSWTANVATGLVAADFAEVTPAGLIFPGNNPDFSASGALMQLGFWRGNSGNGSYATECGIDNWRVEIVPTPGSAAVLGIGALTFCRRRRRS